MELPDFKLISDFFTAQDLKKINNIYQNLSSEAYKIVQYTKKVNCSLADFYYEQPGTLIVVPERMDSDSICRMEYLNGSSKNFYNHITKPVQQHLELIFGAKLALFKDKCNIKVPLGGAFPPHQDAPAYLDFGPKIFITAGIMLDEISLDNGCLHMATNYRDLKQEVIQYCKTPYGEYPLFEYYRGGIHNGDIVNEVQVALDWSSIEAQAGDVLIFNSFVPHFSNINKSSHNRRVIYLTFNLLDEGSYYDIYYQKKWHDYNNPQFHISTPTKHASLFE